MSKIVHQWRLFCYPDTLNSNQREFKSPNGWLENAKPLMVVTVWISSIFKANCRPVILNQLCQLWLNWTKPKRLDWSMVKFCFIRLIFRELFFTSFYVALSDWREVVLHANSVLTWDQEWYAGVIAALVTTFYLAVWYWDPTLVTFIAFSGLFLTLADYVGPKIINQVCTITMDIKRILEPFIFRCTAWINGLQQRRENLTRFVRTSSVEWISLTISGNFVVKLERKNPSFTSLELSCFSFLWRLSATVSTTSFWPTSWPMHFSCCLACTRRESYSSTELLLSWRLMKSSREKTTWKNQNNGGRQNIVYKTLTFHLSFSILTKDCMRLSNIPPWSFSKRNNLLSLLTLG